MLQQEIEQQVKTRNQEILDHLLQPHLWEIQFWWEARLAEIDKAIKDAAQREIKKT